MDVFIVFMADRHLCFLATPHQLLKCKMHCNAIAHQLVRMCSAQETKMVAGYENDQYYSFHVGYSGKLPSRNVFMLP
jgi:hypothetical protein